MRKLFFIYSLILLSWPALSQDSLKDTSGGLPRVFITLDYGKLATYPFSFEQKMEAGFGFRIGKHFTPVVYAGLATLEPENEIKNGDYISEGWFVRAGLEYFIQLDPRNSLILGLRYGMSSFDETLKYTIGSDLFPDITDTATRTGLSASWAEVVFGSDMRLGESRFYLGGYFTLRIMVERDTFEPADTFRIPGYGRTIDKTVPALQLYLKFSLIR